MTKALKNHPGMWMEDAAADDLNALEDKYGVIVINRAGVSEAEQNEVIRKWDQGGKYNRPPYLYPPARPAKSSTHVQGTGLDVYNYTTDRAKLNEFNFEWYGTSDVVHYTHKGRPVAYVPVSDAGGAVPGKWGPNPFGIAFTGGLQKVANLYLPHGGFGKTKLDQNFGPTSMHGFAQFLRSNWGYAGNDVLGPVMWSAIARWLRARYGYEGNDTPGPRMRAALLAADTKNWNELP